MTTSRPKFSIGRHAELKAFVFARDGHACVGCGWSGPPTYWPKARTLEIDHKTPFSRGGGHDEQNLQVLCTFCNASKAALTDEEWRAKKGLPLSGH